MNLKVLSVIGALALALAWWFFSVNQDDTPSTEIAKPDISSEITEIKAVQVNPETGETEYTLTAKSLVQNTKTGQDELKDAHMAWQPPSGESYTIETKTAQLNQSTGELYFVDGFTLTRLATPDKPAMVMTGSQLRGNTKTRTLRTNQGISVTNGDDRFTAQGMQADLAAGEYVFDKIMIEYRAPERKDKRLF